MILGSGWPLYDAASISDRCVMSDPIRSVLDILANKPAWVRRQIADEEASAIADEVAKIEARSAIEVGVGSGFSSAVIFSALAQNTDDPALYSFDLEEDLYFDSSRKTGSAFYEIHGARPGFTLKTRVTSADIAANEIPNKIDFAFIDAHHGTPWPALDLLSVLRFLKPGAVIALHDIRMPFKRKWADQNKNGPRDLYRSWYGEKWRYELCANLGFLRFSSAHDATQSIASTLEIDWDVKIDKSIQSKFSRIASELDSNASRILTVIAQRHHTFKNWRKISEPKNE